MSADGGDKLARMANQIADNFDYGNRDKAVAGVLDHLVRFWTPQMKRTIIDRQRSGALSLNPIADEAVTALAEKLGQAA